MAVKEEDPRRFLHPETIARISRLDLRARHVVEGFISGMHRSPFFGHSVEFVQHREYTPGDDIQALAYPVLRHRILTNFTAASEGVTSDIVVKKLLEDTPSKDNELTRDERFKKIFAS